MPSIFSRIIAGEIPCHKIWEDERFFAFLDIHPYHPGMALIVPKTEIDDAFAMDDETYAAFLIAAKRLIPAIKDATGSARVGLMIEGLEVPHAHIKLIPINGAGDMDATNAKPSTDEDLAAMAEKIRSHLE
jgi:histidine triad (HIT) family protein